MPWDYGRKPEYPKEAHTGTGRTCKLHTVKFPWSICGSNPDVMSYYLNIKQRSKTLETIRLHRSVSFPYMYCKLTDKYKELPKC